MPLKASSHFGPISYFAFGSSQAQYLCTNVKGHILLFLKIRKHKVET